MIVVLLLSIILATTAEKCYSGGTITTYFTFDGTDVLSELGLGKEQLDWQESMVSECAVGNVCIQFDMAVTAEARVDGNTGEAQMILSKQSCLPDGVQGAGDGFREAICTVATDQLKQAWENNPETADLYSNVVADCDGLTACGTDCVLEAHRGADGDGDADEDDDNRYDVAGAVGLQTLSVALLASLFYCLL